MADDEDQQQEGFQEAGEGGVNHAANATTREQNVNKSLNGGRTLDALHAALENPPVGSKDAAVIDKSTALVVNVCTSVKDNEIQKHIDGLSDDEQNTLMKYLYKGLESGDNSTSLLKWHSSLVEKGGLGLIVRALSERNVILTVPDK
eukprot:TRINITY_DN1444_c0_g1_i1.p1 TRINITY_DN1444_c0_g1~~TRINITY_DN1444_c0_g1_i1.p1  ORF type:complete len:147 (+),score=37.38 TRINITY_DN1444_c0_g1_i1:107-547(+)